jgi:two-component system, NtrC family, nitrogen regulation sensor histidine kinase NtrY
MSLVRTFSAALAWRIFALTVAIVGAVLAAVPKPDQKPQLWLSVFCAGIAVWLAAGMFRYVNDTNRRLARFFESVRYSDFAIRFSSAKEKGDSFAEVNRQFNEVLEAFRQTRAEKEANLLFLNTIVQHLSTGLVAFDAQMNVLVSNSAALQLLGVYRLHHLHDLPERHRPLAQFVQGLSTKGKILYQPETVRQLSVQGVSVNLQGRPVRLLTLQNIHPELQRKEVDAWRDLTRVLRHEIMNSVTPIVSLVETAQDIVQHDLEKNPATDDLSEALEIVAARSRGLMDFVEAYRSFTNVPQPKLEDISARHLLDRVAALALAQQKSGDSPRVHLEVFVQPDDLRLQADLAQLEMVLLNLVKNAREALLDRGEERGVRSEERDALTPHSARITLRAGADPKGRPFIEVEDNGPGIPPELLEEIFIPFFTTKTTGSGVGLSISRQIMQLHGGDLRVSSAPGGGARFVLDW